MIKVVEDFSPIAFSFVNTSTVYVCIYFFLKYESFEVVWLAVEF